MRVYIYLEDYGALDRPARTGMEKSLDGLARGLAAAGAETAILCESKRNQTIARTGGGASWTVRSFANEKPGGFQIAPSLRQFVDQTIQPGDLVILNAMFHPSVHTMSKLLRRKGVRYIASPHDPYHDTIFAKNRVKKLPYWYLVERPMLRRAVAVQVLDARHGQMLRDRGVSTPTVEVLNAFDEEAVPDESTLRWSTDGRARLLFLGRMDIQNKGLDLLLGAMKLLKPDQAELTLLGPDNGDLAALKQQAADLQLGDRVRFLGPDFSKTSVEIASAYDVFVLPSRFEGFSMAVMEAMLAGRPVVISQIAGLAPHVERAHAGAVVDATAEAIAAGIAQVVSQRNEWRDIGLRGRGYVLQNLDWRKIGADALRTYQTLC